MKRVISILLAFFMLVSLIPADLAYAQEGQKLDVVLLNNGQYMIKLPGVDYTRLRQASAGHDINPTDNPKEFSSRTVKVDITEIFLQATGIKNLTVIVEGGDTTYRKEYELSVEEAKTGIKVPVPKAKYFPQINVRFDDGRDARYAVEAKTEPTNVVNINIDFMAHTGVATRWYGTADKPDVKGNYVGINKTPHKFDLPKKDQNSILKEGNDPWSWQGHDNPVNLQVVPWSHIICNDEVTANTCHLLVDDKAQGQLASSDYYFQVTGDGLHGFTATMREKNTVDFDAGKGTWKTAKPAQQFAANGLKLSEKFMEAPDTIGPVTVPNGESDLTPPAAEEGQPENVFKGWATTADGPVVDMATFVVEGNTTFYAIYGPKDQGKIKVEYKDSKTNAAIDSKYQLKGQKYPAEKPGNKDEAIKDEVFDKDKAPKFLGYKIKSITTDPIPNPPATANYTKDGDYTVIYTYDKLDDIIPEKKNGQDNPEVTPDVKEHYAKVTFQVAAADAEKAKLQLDSTDATSPLVYYVNPLEGKKIAEVASVKALSKDDNLYKVDANDMWTYDPDSITGTDQVISQLRDAQDNVVKTEITLTAKVADKTAAKFKDKLAPQDIKVWVGDTIDWKKGIAKLNDATLQEILDKTETKVTDESNRNSDAANLPNGKTGNLKVTFEDGSALVVENQTLYVAPVKVPVKPGEDNQIDPDKLPTDKIAVEFLLGEGVKIGTKEGNATTPVLYETYYVKPGTSLEQGDIPATTLQDNYKDNAWYNGTAKLEEADYKNITEAKVFTAKAVLKGQGSARLAFKDDKGNAIDILDTKKDLQFPDQDYVQSMNGKDGAAITYDKSKAPKILGYEFTNEEPVISTPNFKEGATATITLKYKKIDDIIGPNKPDNQKPAGYVTVAFKKATGAELDPSEMSYFVNPKADVKAKVSKVGDNYQISGKKADGTDLTGNVPAVNSTDASKYELKYADADKKWAYDNFDKVGTDIAADTTFTAQVITLGEPRVIYPDVELAPSQSKAVEPKETGDRYGNLIPAEKIGEITVADVPEGVTVTPDPSKGKITITVPKDYKGPRTFKVKLTVKVDGIKNPIDSEINVTVKRPSSPGGGGYIIPSKPEPKPSEGDLNKDDHYQYLIGYPDGTFAPNRGMTRAEVATMFTRLLKDRPVKGQSYAAGLSDVYAGDWYADTVGYAVQKGIVSGYPDGTFKPNQPITRAEFSSIASRFAELTEEKDLTFSDLDASHWGYKAIRLAASNGWISGYPDNTFRPEQAITRAEVTSITNRMLNRYADLDWINAHNDAVIHFSDVSTGDWFFEPIMEATMGHDFTRDADGKTEHWTGLNGKSFI
ncbi:MAG: S-layer homology domain-containing protein [Clostridiales bacterium]|nr:S-layer homology domain-containing protein [Clostridiales bacterium]